MKPFVYVTRKCPEEQLKNLYEIAEVEMWHEEDIVCPRPVLLEKAKHAVALFTMLSDVVDRELLDSAKNLKVVANCAVGYDNIDVECATEKGIAICNTPDVLNDTTADLTFGLLMATARRIVEASEFVKNGEWKSWSPLLLAGSDIHHKTIGIVGMGKIGQALAKRASGFDMDILYHNRSRNETAEKKLGATYCELSDLLQKSDFVVCLTPLTDETHHLFNSDLFRMMKNSAIFINASRGAVVNEEDLYQALLRHEIAGAGLDVFENEPIDASHPLLTLSNVVALPHIGSASIETRQTMMLLCSENIVNALLNKEPKTRIN